MEVKVRLLGADSIGARSLSTCIETEEGIKIMIDPGVSYAPRRYGLPPHPREMTRLCEIKERIKREIEDADIIVITHYHYDHYLYHKEDIELYRNKILLIKNPEEKINFSQRIRAYRLLQKNRVKDLAKKILFLDSNKVKITRLLNIIGSEPYPHGSPGTKLGYIVMPVVNCCNITVLFGSDVQGPIDTSAKKYILHVKPDILIMSGPPLYLSGSKLEEEEVEKGVINLKHIVAQLRNASIIVDHHSARSQDYLSLLAVLKRANPRVVSGAEYMNTNLELLEAMRKELWENEPKTGETINCN